MAWTCDEMTAAIQRHRAETGALATHNARGAKPIVRHTLSRPAC